MHGEAWRLDFKLPKGEHEDSKTRKANLICMLILASFIGCFSLYFNAYLLRHFWSCLTGSCFPRATSLPVAFEQRAGAFGENGFLTVGERSGRILASDGNSADASSDHQGGDHSHKQDALLFLFNAIIFGVILLQLTTIPKLHHMQQTVALFVLGVLYSLVQEGLTLNKHIGAFGHSYDMWMHIDPHLMLFTMLPALLAGDAMSLDTNVVKRVAGQCMYLAGPGVILNLLLAAGFLKIYISQYDWPFELCLTAGAILAATDPVAVVSLLKQLGAAPSLTILIQGESLLNDGTAIVCFVLAYDMLQGESYGFGGVMVFVVRKVVCACGLGWVIGWTFVVWINAASDRFEHHSSMIQICLTICCAYWSFIMAEGVLDMNGVLCTVSASLVMADNMWPSIVHRDKLLHMWHVIEFVGNTLIFFLAGALTGNCMIEIPMVDYLHLLVIYLVMTLIRAFVIIASLPILRRLGKAQLPLSEALVMTWGGLRGAVGLALAIQVRIEKANGKIDDMNSRRVLFYTGGIAFLTLAVNAVTCPALVKFLGLVQSDHVKRRLLMKVCGQMVRQVHVDDLKRPVKMALEEMMQTSDDHMAIAYNMHVSEMEQKQANKFSGGNGRRRSSLGMMGKSSSRGSSKTTNGESVSLTHSINASYVGLRDKLRMKLMAHQAVFEGDELLTSFADILTKMSVIPKSVYALLNIPEPQDLKLSSSLLDLVVTLPDPEVMELINVALLSLVQAEYWSMIEDGEFIKGSNHPEILLNSTTWAMQSKTARLADFEFLISELGHHRREKPVAVEDKTRASRVEDPTKSSSPKALEQGVMLSGLLTDRCHERSSETCLVKFVRSTAFNIAITIVIILNVINVFIEEARTSDKHSAEENYDFWLTVEVLFTTIFLSEFLLKVVAFGRQYFTDGWNIFDFLLVISGIFGIIVELVWKNSDAAVSSEARVFRINRLFRALRLMRVFRLVQLLEVLRARYNGLEVSLHLARNMRSITILTAFARAHYKAEKELEKFFGSPLDFNGSELARCLLDSRTAVCDAICSAAFEIGKMEIVILERLQALRESGHITEDLTHFILEAGAMGIMNTKEAEHLLKPLQKQQQEWFNEEKHHMAGIYDRQRTAELIETSQFNCGSPTDSCGIAGVSSPTMSRRGSLRLAINQVMNPFDIGQNSVDLDIEHLENLERMTTSLEAGKIAGEADDPVNSRPETPAQATLRICASMCEESPISASHSASPIAASPIF